MLSKGAKPYLIRSIVRNIYSKQDGYKKLIERRSDPDTAVGKSLRFFRRF